MGKQYNIKVSFTEHLPHILGLAKQQGMNKTMLCERSGIDPKRISDFQRGRKKLTVFYFLKFLGGLGVPVEAYEEKTGKQLNEQQQHQTQIHRFADREQELIEKLIQHPEYLVDVKLLGQKYES